MVQPTSQRGRFFWGVGVCLVLALALALGPGLARAQWDRAVIRVGVLEEPKSLNLWLASDAWSNRVLSLVYTSLYEREPHRQELVPWLAASLPVFDPKTKSYTVELRPAKWSDGSPLTAHDVVFTANLIKKFKIPRFAASWAFVDKVEALDERRVRFVLKQLKATFLTRTLSTPIVPRAQWEPVAQKALGTKKPLTTLLRAPMEHPVGSGPFVVNRWRRGVFVYLTTNPHFFAQGQTIAGFKLGPFIRGIIFKVYGTSDAAILGLRKGSIDMYWNDIQPGYLHEIKDDPNIQIFSNQKSALYFLGFNLRKKPFDDPALRQAVAYLINREFIIKRILQGAGEALTSIVPPGNRFFHNPHLPVYGQGLDREQRIKKAYEILKAAGYSWEDPPVDDQGQVQQGEGMLLPGGKPMASFTILTPPADYDPNRAMAGMMIQEWLRQVGMPVAARPMAFGALIQQVKYRHQFECFVLGYGNLKLDPGYLWSFFHSKNAKPRGWNMSGYSNPAYDKLATKANNTMDQDARRKIVFTLQEMLMNDLPYVPLYNPSLDEGVRKDRFKDWVPMVGGIGNLWSFCLIRPKAGAGD